MTKVFLSYKRDDVEFAEFIRQQLLGWGYQVWMDIYDIPKGAYWPDAIDEALKTMDIVVGVMSPEAVVSRNVKNEWDWALVNEKPVLLLMLRETQIPVNYISINYIDFRKSRDTGVKHLHEALLSAFTGAYQLSPEKIAAMPKPDQARKTQEVELGKKERKPSTPKPINQPQKGFSSGLLLAIAITVGIGIIGIVVLVILLVVAANGDKDNAVDNAERFISEVGSGDLVSARDYVCDSWRDTLPDTFHNFWVGQGAFSLTNPSCSGGGNTLRCSYTVTYTNGLSQTHTNNFTMQDNLVCDIQ